VPHFAHISAALSDLLKKGTKFVWTAERERAFLDLKSRLATQPILRPPDFGQPFFLAVLSLFGQPKGSELSWT